MKRELKRAIQAPRLARVFHHSAGSRLTVNRDTHAFCDLVPVEHYLMIRFRSEGRSECLVMTALIEGECQSVMRWPVDDPSVVRDRKAGAIFGPVGVLLAGAPY